MGREVLLIACVLAVCTTAYVDESSTNAVTNPAKARVLLTALPLRGHLLALQALAASLSNRGYAVTVVGFDDAPVAPNPKLQFQSLGPIPAGFDPYTNSLAEVATLHRYRPLSPALPLGPSTVAVTPLCPLSLRLTGSHSLSLPRCVCTCLSRTHCVRLSVSL